MYVHAWHFPFSFSPISFYPLSPSPHHLTLSSPSHHLLTISFDPLSSLSLSLPPFPFSPIRMHSHSSTIGRQELDMTYNEFSAVQVVPHCLTCDNYLICGDSPIHTWVLTHAYMFITSMNLIISSLTGSDFNFKIATLIFSTTANLVCLVVESSCSNLLIYYVFELLSLSVTCRINTDAHIPALECRKYHGICVQCTLCMCICKVLFVQCVCVYVKYCMYNVYVYT